MAQPLARSSTTMTQDYDLVFLFDVDNTLFDNDRVEADLADYLRGSYGVED
jgi:FMN phosphatase YigB (HAD superfamily)